MTDNIIQVAFGSLRVRRVSPQYKIDYGLKIEFVDLDLPEVFEAHFCNEGDLAAERELGNNNVISVPNKYLKTGRTVECYIYLHPTEESGLTKYIIKIPVKSRPKVVPSEPDSEQRDVIETAIAALEAGVARVESAAKEIEEMARVTYTDDGDGNITVAFLKEQENGGSVEAWQDLP